MENESYEKNYSKIQWFFYVIFIPLLFAILLTLIILTVSGLNIFSIAKEYGSKVPVISSIITGEEEDEKSLTPDPFALEAKIEEQEEAISQYESEIAQKEEEITSLQQEIEQLMMRLNEKQEAKQQTDEELTKLVDLYENMKPKNAAAILSNMDQEDTVDIMTMLGSETLAAIMSEMTPEDAASLTEALKRR